MCRNNVEGIAQASRGYKSSVFQVRHNVSYKYWHVCHINSKGCIYFALTEDSNWRLGCNLSRCRCVLYCTVMCCTVYCRGAAPTCCDSYRMLIVLQAWTLSVNIINFIFLIELNRTVPVSRYQTIKLEIINHSTEGKTQQAATS